MELNQSTLRGILAAILSVNENYVVLKQGNWWNPQEKSNSPNNWCAYRIKSNRPRSAPFYNTDGKTNRVCVEKIAEIELQFVGPDSEEIANNVSTWALRADVKEQFAKVQGAIMYDDMNAIATSFYQDGTNNITAWNVTLRVRWVSILDTGQQKLTAVYIN